jgi:hypothetical protein
LLVSISNSLLVFYLINKELWLIPIIYNIAHI